MIYVCSYTDEHVRSAWQQCSLSSKDNREPDYDVKTRTLTGYEGPGLPMSGCCTTDSPHPRGAQHWSQRDQCWSALWQQGVFFRTSSILKVPKKPEAAQLWPITCSLDEQELNHPPLMTVMEDERSPTAWDSLIPQGLHSHSLSDSNCESVNRVTFFGSIWFAALSNQSFCPLTPTGVVEAWYYHWPNIKYCLLQNGILEWKFNPYGQNQRSCRIYQSKHNFVWKNEILYR